MPKPLVIENPPGDRNVIDAVRRHAQIVCEKQQIDVFSNPIVERLVRALPPHAIVFGVATDHCVRSSALGLRRLGIKTAVLTDAVRGITAESETRALEEMRAAGSDFTTSEVLLAAYAA
jgi:nicotinamidase/pyrazinamidase